MELFVYVNMREEGEQAQPDVLFLGGETVRRQWTSFDALKCECVNAADKERIMAVIQAGDGGVEGFNRSVAAIGAATMQSKEPPTSAGTSSQEDTFLAQRLLRARATRSSRCADTWDTRAEARHEVYAEPPRGDHEEDLAV